MVCMEIQYYFFRGNRHLLQRTGREVERPGHLYQTIFMEILEAGYTENLKAVIRGQVIGKEVSKWTGLYQVASYIIL